MIIKFTREKREWLVVAIVIFALLLGWLFSEFFLVQHNNRFTPSPVKMRGVSISLDCIANNTRFITEESEFECYVSTIAERIEYSHLSLIIRAFNIENMKEAIWGCSTQFFNITNETPKRNMCKGGFPELFKPSVAGLYKFEIYSFSGLTNYNIEIDTVAEDKNRFFIGNMEVLSKRESISLDIANKSFMVALLAILLFVPNLIFELRKFLKE